MPEALNFIPSTSWQGEKAIIKEIIFFYCAFSFGERFEY